MTACFITGNASFLSLRIKWRYVFKDHIFFGSWGKMRERLSLGFPFKFCSFCRPSSGFCLQTHSQIYSSNDRPRFSAYPSEILQKLPSPIQPYLKLLRVDKPVGNSVLSFANIILVTCWLILFFLPHRNMAFVLALCLGRDNCHWLGSNPRSANVGFVRHRIVFDARCSMYR